MVLKPFLHQICLCYKEIVGAVDEAVKQIINKANCDQVPYVYGLKRRLIGKLAKKQTPASCIAITNYEGIEVGMLTRTNCMLENYFYIPFQGVLA